MIKFQFENTYHPAYIDLLTVDKLVSIPEANLVLLFGVVVVDSLENRCLHCLVTRARRIIHIICIVVGTIARVVIH